MAIIGQSLRLTPQSGTHIRCMTAQQIDILELKGVAIVGCYQGREKFMGFVPPVNVWHPQSSYRDYVADIVDQTGNPVDISGSQLIWILFESVTGATLLQKGTVAGTMTKSSASRVQWSIQNDESELFAGPTYYHELWEINAAGDRRLTIYGDFRIQDTRGFDV